MDTTTKNKLMNLLEKYPFMIKREKEPLKATDLLKHKINLRTDKPIYTRNYRYPIHFGENVNDETDKLLKTKVIRKSNSRVWVVPKKLYPSETPKIRMVIDYRKLNRETKSHCQISKTCSTN